MTVLEGSPRAGGWLQSKRVEKPGGTILFETGPHTLRPTTLSGYAGLELIKQIDLEKEILWVSKDSTASKNRYVKYEDRLVLLRPPKRFILDTYFLKEPLLRRAIGGVLKFGIKSPRRPAGMEDESVASWFERRFNKHIARYFVSALMHGVYAGDYKRLSMRSTFLKPLWDMETAGKRFMKPPLEDDLFGAELKMGMGLELMRKASDSRMYSFKDGTESLSRRLTEKLKGQVTIRTDSPVQSIKSEGDQIKVRTGLQSQSFSHIISTIPLPHLFRTVPGPPKELVSSFPAAVTVAVVNLYYPGGSLIMPIHGFGYLIPKTDHGNLENALGVIIVSDGIQGQDTGKYESGVKLTVMLGGHYWRGRTSYPSDDELLAAAKNVVARDLGITAEPSVNLVTLQRECIPQYEVGHWERIQKLEGYLDSTFGRERVKIVGSAVDGVGVNDCILSARRMAKRMGELASLEDVLE